MGMPRASRTTDLECKKQEKLQHKFAIPMRILFLKTPGKETKFSLGSDR